MPSRTRLNAVLLALVAVACLWCRDLGAGPEQNRHAVLSFRGNLDTGFAADAFAATLGTMEDLGAGLIVIEIDGDTARPDLLDRVIRVVTKTDTPLAVYLGDRGDRRVGPGQLAVALAADHAALMPGTVIERETGHDLTALNPEIEDWSVIGLDLRARAKGIADARGVPSAWVEALLAPRSDVWLGERRDGTAALSGEAVGGAERVVERGEGGWSFRMKAADAGRVYGLGSHRTARLFARSLGFKGRPLEGVEVVSDLETTHARCLLLVDRVRTAIGLAEAAMDVFANRRGQERIGSRHYHKAADTAEALVEESRAAIAEIAGHTARLPELLCLDPPEDTRTPTEIGGPSRSRLSLWRGAVSSAERALSSLDDRIEAYRRK